MDEAGAGWGGNIYILFRMVSFYMKEKMGLQIYKMKFPTR